MTFVGPAPPAPESGVDPDAMVVHCPGSAVPPLSLTTTLINCKLANPLFVKVQVTEAPLVFARSMVALVPVVENVLAPVLFTQTALPAGLHPFGSVSVTE